VSLAGRGNEPAQHLSSARFWCAKPSACRHPLGFRETIYGAYVKTSRTEASVRPGPRIGQDNDFVFKELLGIPEERYRRLVQEQVIY
jgi:hypothetical protein